VGDLAAAGDKTLDGFFGAAFFDAAFFGAAFFDAAFFGAAFFDAAFFDAAFFDATGLVTAFLIEDAFFDGTARFGVGFFLGRAIARRTGLLEAAFFAGAFFADAFFVLFLGAMVRAGA